MLTLLVIAVAASLVAISTRRQLQAERNARGFWAAEKAECERLLTKIRTEAVEAPRKAQAEKIIHKLLAEGVVKVPSDLQAAYKHVETVLELEKKEHDKEESKGGEVITLSKGKRA